MSVRIAHASISEHGTVNGTAGDQTGKEVCVRPWYDKGWDYMAIHPLADVRAAHALAASDAAANKLIGYSQAQRNTLNTQAKKVGYNFELIRTACNCDCSSLQHVVAIASGAVGTDTYKSNGWTTSTMKAGLKKAGYVILTDRKYLSNSMYAVKGAIYVKEGSHTVCALDNGILSASTLAAAGLKKKSPAGKTYGGTLPALPPRGYYRQGDGYETYKKYTTQISRVQKFLNWAVGADLNVDGDYGPRTAGACKQFQKAAGIESDGKFGSATLKAAANYRKGN